MIDFTSMVRSLVPSMFAFCVADAVLEGAPSRVLSKYLDRLRDGPQPYSDEVYWSMHDHDD